ncbi:hypothetical protein BH11BAC5_BH11BAC5_26010 [soil metagenome]
MRIKIIFLLSIVHSALKLYSQNFEGEIISPLLVLIQKLQCDFLPSNVSAVVGVAQIK